MDARPIAAGKSSFDLVDPHAVFRVLAVKPGEVVADLACGQGQYALPLAERVGPEGLVHAVDLWQEGVQSVADAAAVKGLENVRPLHADITRPLPIDGESVNLVLLATVLHDLKGAGKDADVLAGAHRILEPQGRLAVIEFLKLDPPPGPPKITRIDPLELNKRVEPLGFEPVRTLAVSSWCYLSEFRKR